MFTWYKTAQPLASTIPALLLAWVALLSSATQGMGIDIEAGRQHWAFQPLKEVAPPSVKATEWPCGEVDRFVLARLEASGLNPVGDADRYTWLRRVSFDLTGLPPTIEEIRSFEADESPRANEKVVDRLLESSAFGERWARHWLDLVGYADQIGTSNNVFAEHGWRYRDYVIDAYNHDKPFDRFVREQIAGDLLPYNSVEERADNLVATGFLLLGDIEIVEADKAKLRVDIIDKQIQKVSKALLGMTLDCARCHDHKFDPISQRDYYAIGGMFHGTSSEYKTDRGVWSDINVVDLPETDAQIAERKARTAAHDERLAALGAEREQAGERKQEVDAALVELAKVNEDGNLQTARTALENVQRDLGDRIQKLDRQIVHAEFFAPTVPRAYAVQDAENPGDMRITVRGNPRALDEEVPRGFLRVISDTRPDIPPGHSGRLELADWIASPNNPLTARVAVNRIWQKLFGEGLVRSVDYFGLPGARPSHPELLDFLARRFIGEGWSRKRLISELVLSRTYRLAGDHNALAHETDPENRLLWRMNRVRLDAEALRDAMVFISGQLLPSTGGPALPLEFMENVGGLNPTDVNPPSFSLTKWRPGQEFQRTIYLPVVRDSAQEGAARLRNVFDFPNPSELAGKRAVTAVPTQALFLMNSSVVKEHATALAKRVQADATGETQRLEILWLRSLARPISDDERQETIDFLRNAGEDAWPELCHALLASNEFLMRL